MNLNSLSDLELEATIEESPWFAAAWMEYVHRSMVFGIETAREAAEYAALFVADRWILYAELTGMPLTRTIPPVAAKREEPAPVPSPAPQEKEDKKPVYIVAGGDYFGKDDFKELEASGDAFDISQLKYNPISSALVSAEVLQRAGQDEARATDAAVEGLCTETLAGIYRDQQLFDRAIDAYEKLILLYPEKSAYFAALIETTKELKETNNKQ